MQKQSIESEVFAASAQLEPQGGLESSIANVKCEAKKLCVGVVHAYDTAPCPIVRS